MDNLPLWPEGVRLGPEAYVRIRDIIRWVSEMADKSPQHCMQQPTESRGGRTIYRFG